MNRSAFASPLALLLCATVTTGAFAQVKPAAPTTPAPAARAKFVSPIKGLATIDVVASRSKYVGDEVLTTYKIRNTSSAPIALLKIEEYWYDKAGKLVSSDTQRYRQPLQPGEVVEMTTRAPKATGLERNQATFSHANGTVKPTRVKEIKEKK